MGRFTRLRDFYRFLTFRITRIVLVSVIVLSIIPGTLIGYFPSDIRWIYAILFSGLTMIALYTPLQMIAGSTIQFIQLQLYNRKHKPRKHYDPEVKRIAQRIGLTYDKPLYITDNPSLTSPFVNLFSEKITMPSSWLRKFYPTENYGAIGHELGHIKLKPRFMKQAGLLMLAPLAFTAVFALGTIALGLFFVPVICQIATLAVTIILFSYILWCNEFKADEISGNAVGPEPLIAVFQALHQDMEHDEGSITHPPLRERIKRLYTFFLSDDE